MEYCEAVSTPWLRSGKDFELSFLITTYYVMSVVKI